MLLFTAVFIAVAWAHEKFVRVPERNAQAAQRKADQEAQRIDSQRRNRAAEDEQKRALDRDEARRAEESRARNLQYARRLEAETNRQALQRMLPLIAKWDDAARLARAAPRIALAPQIRDLQSIRREFSASPPVASQCLMPAHQAMLSVMDEQISMLIAFLANDERTAGKHAQAWSASFERFKASLDRCTQSY